VDHTAERERRQPSRRLSYVGFVFLRFRHA